jgi:hypothetical protein
MAALSLSSSGTVKNMTMLTSRCSRLSLVSTTFTKNGNTNTSLLLLGGLRRSNFSSDVSSSILHPRTPVPKAERTTLRASRKERAAQFMQQQAKGGNIEGDAASTAAGAAVAASTKTEAAARGLMSSKYIWYASIGIPTALLVWGFSDSNSPPAKLSKWIGLTGFIQQYTDEIAKPSHDKLLPDWSQVNCF